MFQDQAILLSEIQGEGLSPVQNPWTNENFLTSLREPTNKVFVWELSHQAEGFILYRENLRESSIYEIEILHLAVRHKGTGNGTLMFKSFFAKIKDLASKRVIFLDVNPQNKGAVNLYEKMGFFQVGVRKKYYKTGDDAWLMKLELNR